MQDLSSEEAKKGAARPPIVFVLVVFVLVFILIASILSLVAIGISVALGASAIVVAAATGVVLLVSAVIAGFAGWRIAKEICKTEDLEVPQEGVRLSRELLSNSQDSNAADKQNNSDLKARLLTLFKKGAKHLSQYKDEEHSDTAKLDVKLGNTIRISLIGCITIPEAGWFNCMSYTDKHNTDKHNVEKVVLLFNRKFKASAFTRATNSISDSAGVDFNEFNTFFKHFCSVLLEGELSGDDYTANVSAICDFERSRITSDLIDYPGNKNHFRVIINKKFIERLENKLEKLEKSNEVADDEVPQKGGTP